MSSGAQVGLVFLAMTTCLKPAVAAVAALLRSPGAGASLCLAGVRP